MGQMKCPLAPLRNSVRVTLSLMGLCDFFFNCLNPTEDPTLDPKPWAAPIAGTVSGPRIPRPQASLLERKGSLSVRGPQGQSTVDGLLGGGGASDQLLLLPPPPSRPQGHLSQPTSLSTKSHTCLITTQCTRTVDCPTGA